MSGKSIVTVIKNRNDAKNVFNKILKRSTTSLAETLKNFTEEERKILCENLQIDYTDDWPGQIEEIVTYISKNEWPNEEKKQPEPKVKRTAKVFDTYKVDLDSIKEDKEFKELYPPMPPTIYEETKKSIQDHGMMNPITFWNCEGIPVLVDGYHRYKIWQELKGKVELKYQVVDFDSRDDAKRFIKDQNELRRHLDKFKAAVVALEALPLKKEEVKKKAAENRVKTKAGEKAKGEGIQGSALQQVAQEHGVSASYVQDVKQVMESGDEQLIEEVKTGKTSAPTAVKKIREKKKPKPLVSPKEEAILECREVFMRIMVQKYGDEEFEDMDEFERDYIGILDNMLARLQRK